MHGVGGRQAVSVPELFSYALWPGGVASISCTIHGKLWRKDNLRVLWVLGKAAVQSQQYLQKLSNLNVDVR